MIQDQVDHFHPDRLYSGSPPPYSRFRARAQELLPGIEHVGRRGQLPGNHVRKFAALKPALNSLAFESFIKFTTDFDRCS